LIGIAAVFFELSTSRVSAQQDKADGSHRFISVVIGLVMIGGGAYLMSLLGVERWVLS
jgi:hypothetical protein